MQTSQPAITAYFADRASAEQAMDELRAAGVDANDMELRDKHAGSGFLETLKRFFTGQTDQDYTEGVLLTVYGERATVLPVLRQYDAHVGDYAADTYDDGATGTADSQAMQLREERLSVDKQASDRR